MTVAIIDSGVRPDHPHVGGRVRGTHLTPDGEDDDYLDRVGHGTAVAAAIREKAPDATLFVIRVFEQALATSGEMLARAIARAAAPDVGAHLINLSLGTRNAAHQALLRRAVAAARAAGEGALVVSAVASGDDGDDSLWLPGSLDGVLGVRLNREIDRGCVAIEAGAGGRVVLAASGYARPIPGVPLERNLRGVSFAVANATGVLSLAAEVTPGGGDALVARLRGPA